MIIVIDGPNKAGKSTLIARVREKLTAKHILSASRHWGPVEPDDRVYTDMLIEDAYARRVTIWDRSWASEHVYGVMCERQRRLVDNPFLGEWLHRRMLFNNYGLAITLLPAFIREELLDASDEQFSRKPFTERELFREYSEKFKWLTLSNDYTEATLETNADKIVTLVNRRYPGHAVDTDFVQEPLGQKHKILFVGDTFWFDHTQPGQQLPFTSYYGTVFANTFGPAALTAAWSTISGIENISISDYETIVVTQPEVVKFVMQQAPFSNIIPVNLQNKLANDEITAWEHAREASALGYVQELLQDNYGSAKFL